MLSTSLLSRPGLGHCWKTVVALTLTMLLAVSAVVAAEASAAQVVIPKLKRISADTVKYDQGGERKLLIDGVDDKRVDAGIAILDAGVDMDHPDLNVVAGIECVNTLVPGVCDAVSPEAGNDIFEDDSGGSTLTPEAAGHGTGTAYGVAAIDNDFGMVGVAPGARIYAVRESINVWQKVAEGKEAEENGPPGTEGTWDIDLTPTIAALRWVADNADEIDVAVGGLHSLCLYEKRDGTPYPYCGDEEQIEEFEEAAEEVVDAGVVWVLQASNMQMNVVNFVGPSNPNPIVAGGMADWDGKPGGEATAQKCGTPLFALHEALTDLDDSSSEVSNWGNNVDIASPACATSGAGPIVAGAAALLASISHPENRADVEEIRETLLGDGDCAENAPKEGPNVGTGSCNWTHDPANHPGEPADTVHEPLLDVSNTSVFAPKVVPGSDPGAVDSDVNGDGKADLVSLRHDGVVYVHPGNGEGKFGSGEASFKSAPLDPAQYDGTGEYVVDVADVDGDLRADLVTLRDDGNVDVYRGEATSRFDEDAITSPLNLSPGLPGTGGTEPIAVADVDGGGRADLIVYDEKAGDVMVYRAKADGSFGHYGPHGHAGPTGASGPYGVTAVNGIASALRTGKGHFFIDAADVTGDNRADLVSMHEGSLEVFKAHEYNGTFLAPVVSQNGAIDPAMDDGSGYEPVGLGDVTKDGYADLALVKSGTLYLYPGSSGGSFGTAVTSFAGSGPSTTFGSGAVEYIGLLDVNGDGNSDLAGALSANSKARVVLGQASGVFSTTATTASPTFPSTQHLKNQNSSGNEFVSEKPSWRRAGCSAENCPRFSDLPLYMFSSAGNPCNPCTDAGFEGLISAENSSHESLGGCDVEFGIRVEYLGELEATNVETSNCTYGMATAAACELPWQGEVRLTHDGQIKVNLATCLKGAYSSPVYHDLSYLTHGQESGAGTGIESWEQISQPDHYYPFGIDGSEFEDHSAADSVRLSEEE